MKQIFDRNEFLKKIQHTPFWNAEINFGRFEDGVVDFAARENNTLFVVCVKCETLEEFQELDFSAEATLEELSHHEKLYVAVRTFDNQPDKVIFDSFPSS